MLITVRSGSWGLPKGGIKKNDSPLRTARIETLEEAGALGRIDRKSLGTFTYRKRGRKQSVEVFGLEVEHLLDRWAEEENRSRVWVSITEAPSLLGRGAWTPMLTRLRHALLTRSEKIVRQASAHRLRLVA